MKTITFISNQDKEIQTKTAVVEDLSDIPGVLLAKLHEYIKDYPKGPFTQAIHVLEKQLLVHSTTIIITDHSTKKTEVLEKQPNGTWEPQVIKGSCTYAATFLTTHWETSLDNYLSNI